jgi:hypothetical protein
VSWPATNFTVPYTGISLIFSNSEDGSNMFLRNVDNFVIAKEVSFAVLKLHTNHSCFVDRGSIPVMVTVPTACRDYKLMIQVIPQVIVRARLCLHLTLRASSQSSLPAAVFCERSDVPYEAGGVVPSVSMALNYI